MADGTIVEGTTFAYTVVAKNKSGTVIPVGDAAVALSDPALGSNALALDGSGGLFTSSGGVGTEVLTPSAAGVTGTPYTLDITADTVVASVTVVAAPPATVTVVPA